MDLSLYEFDCQRALQHGLQYARRLNHGQLEVEHVALSMVQMALIGGFTPAQLEGMADILSLQLQKSPRVLGLKGELAFGKRLDKALDRAEFRSKGSRVDTKVLWKSLTEQSTILQLAVQKVSQERPEDRGFQPTRGEDLGTVRKTPADAKSRDKAMQALRQYTVDLSSAAEAGDLDPIIGRDEEVRRVFEILGRKKKNNPLLLGEPGVGKSAVAEAIALRISEGTVPDSMKTRRVLSLDLGLLLSGTKYRGDFEGRMKDLLEALRNLDGEVILFVDEIHMVMGAGSTEGGVDAANMLKPALARGELHCIGATTFDEFRKHIEKDAALERRFQPLQIDEPDNPTALAILRGLKSRYEIHHGVKIDDSALVAAVELSSRYLASRRLPDKAIDLVDEAASRLKLEVESVPAVLDQLRAQIERFEIEKKAVGGDDRFRSAIARIDAQLAQVREEHNRVEAIWLKHKELLLRRSQIERQRDNLRASLEKARSISDYDLAAKIQYSDLPDTASSLQQIDASLTNLQTEHSFLRQVVGVTDVTQVMSDWTGIPTSKFNAADREDTLTDKVGHRVFGQSHAVDAVCRAVMRSRVGINDPKRPIGVFLFLGPTGVGKTELAKALAAELFHDESRLIRFDMSEYSEAHNVARLVGSPPGYVGFDHGGELTEALKRQPYSVVLLDEMDKAHGRINDLLLQAFDDGRLTDGRGRLVDLRHATFIMTANIFLDTTVESQHSDEFLRKQLAQIWRPEFVNRIDEVVIFSELQVAQHRQILSRHLKELNHRLQERQMRVSLSPRLGCFICDQAASSEFGARAIQRLFKSLVLDQVTDRILKEPFLVEGAWVLDWDEDQQVTWSKEFVSHYYLPPASSD